MWTKKKETKKASYHVVIYESSILGEEPSNSKCKILCRSLGWRVTENSVSETTKTYVYIHTFSRANHSYHIKIKLSIYISLISLIAY